MYIPDLTVYMPDKHRRLDMNILAIGWLSTNGYSTGPVSEAFLHRLKLFCSDPALSFFGLNDCPLCLQSPSISRSDKDLELGSGELRIKGLGNIVYAAPDLIYHYVKDHQYQPPTEFVEAILNSHLPDTVEYQEFVNIWRKR